MNIFLCREHALLKKATLCDGLLNSFTVAQFPQRCCLGGVVERLMAPVLKTGRAKALVGSNPTPSAMSKDFRSSLIHPFRPSISVFRWWISDHGNPTHNDVRYHDPDKNRADDIR